MSGIVTRRMPSSNTLFKTLKKLGFGGFKLRSPNSMGLISTSQSGLCSLTKLDLSYCNLNAIPNHICYLFSLELHFPNIFVSTFPNSLHENYKIIHVYHLKF